MKLNGNTLTIGDLQITFQRTLRLPEDGKTHALPPGLGSFPIKKVDDYKNKVPKSWRKHGGVFLPMYQREAMWLSFGGWGYTKPCAVKVACGKVNAVSGQPWNEKLKKPRKVSGKDPEQDYMVCPNQPWLDGFNTGDGVIRQFVAMPLGMGYTVEGQVTGEEKHGGIQIKVFPVLPGKIKEPDVHILNGTHPFCGTGSAAGVYHLSANSTKGITYDSLSMNDDYCVPVRSRGLKKAGAEMGLAAGGKMKQKIYEDPHGFNVWDKKNSERLFVHIVNSAMYKEITGEDAPSSPIDAHTYTTYGYPWFDIYDENEKDVQGSGTLANVKPVSEKDAEHGFKNQQDDSKLDESKNVKMIGKKKKKKKKLAKNEVRDGSW
jgi:hypothetical protein